MYHKYCSGHACFKCLVVVHLQHQFNWMSCIFLLNLAALGVPFMKLRSFGKSSFIQGLSGNSPTWWGWVSCFHEALETSALGWVNPLDGCTLGSLDSCCSFQFQFWPLGVVLLSSKSKHALKRMFVTFCPGFSDVLKWKGFRLSGLPYHRRWKLGHRFWNSQLSSLILYWCWES